MSRPIGDAVWFGLLAILLGATIGLFLLGLMLQLPQLIPFTMAWITENPKPVYAIVVGGLVGLICYIIGPWRTS